MKTFGDKAYQFFTDLPEPPRYRGIVTMNPYEDAAVKAYVRQFFKKFYDDAKPRIGVFGINPGRFGSGVTGVTFTDPVALETYCGIPNHFPKVRERSSEFIYETIGRMGGAAKFYNRFFLGAVSPLGFTKKGINYNYYDDPGLYRASKPFIVESMRRQIALGLSRDVAFVIGTGKNYAVFQELNGEYGFFKNLRALEHPRFIMQYRRKRLEEYLGKYQTEFKRKTASS